MGFGSKLTVAFVTVILVMTLVQAGVSVFVNWTSARTAARKTVDTARLQLERSKTALWDQNLLAARTLADDGAFKEAVIGRDKAGTAAAVKSFCERSGFGGYVSVITRDGKVFFSSDVGASRTGMPASQINVPILDWIFEGKGPLKTVCPPSDVGDLAMAGIVPLMSGSRVDAAVFAYTPLNQAAIIGLQKQVELGPAAVKGFDLAFLSVKDSRVTAATPELSKNSGGFIEKLNQEGARAPFFNEAEYGGRLWKIIQLPGPNAKFEIGRIYVGAPIPEFLPTTLTLLGQLGAGAAAAFVLSLLFAAGISRRFDTSIRFLKQRAKELAENKPNLRSLDGIGGEWIELGEMMDTAVAQPRNAVQSLRQQIAQKEEDLQEKQRQIEAINNQLEAVNRQLTSSNRQSADINAQVNSAQQQAMMIQQKMEQQTHLLQQKLANVLQVSTEGYLLLDPYGSVLSANPMFLNWMGVSEREIAGRMCFDLVKKPGEPRDSRSMQNVRPQAPGDLINYFYPEGVVYHRNNEKTVEVLIHLQPVVTDDSTIQGYTMVLRDKSMHSELNRLRNEVVAMLKDEIRRRLSECEPAWTSIMSNQSQLQGVSPHIVQSILKLQTINQELLGIVDSYLMMYGGFVPVEVVQREPISITRLIGECLEQVAPRAREQQIMLDYKTVTGLPNTATNKDVVKDVIAQLLEKMIAVTAPGGRVRAETAVKGKEIRLIISSSGPALQQDDIEEMFVGFIDGKHHEETYQSRLSMYLARSNAERLGGKLWAESEAGRGTAIFLTLPVH